MVAQHEHNLHGSFFRPDVDAASEVCDMHGAGGAVIVRHLRHHACHATSILWCWMCVTCMVLEVPGQSCGTIRDIRRRLGLSLRDVRCSVQDLVRSCLQSRS